MQHCSAHMLRMCFLLILFRDFDRLSKENIMVNNELVSNS